VEAAVAGGGTTAEEDEAAVVLEEAAVQVVEDMEAEDMALAGVAAAVLVLIADGTVI
jgi:hypothetical protein